MKNWFVKWIPSVSQSAPSDKSWAWLHFSQFLLRFFSNFTKKSISSLRVACVFSVQTRTAFSACVFAFIRRLYLASCVQVSRRICAALYARDIASSCCWTCFASLAWIACNLTFLFVGDLGTKWKRSNGLQQPVTVETSVLGIVAGKIKFWLLDRDIGPRSFKFDSEDGRITIGGLQSLNWSLIDISKIAGSWIQIRGPKSCLTSRVDGWGSDMPTFPSTGSRVGFIDGQNNVDDWVVKSSLSCSTVRSEIGFVGCTPVLHDWMEVLSLSCTADLQINFTGLAFWVDDCVLIRLPISIFSVNGVWDSIIADRSILTASTMLRFSLALDGDQHMIYWLECLSVDTYRWHHLSFSAVTRQNRLRRSVSICLGASLARVFTRDRTMGIDLWSWAVFGSNRWWVPRITEKSDRPKVNPIFKPRQDSPRSVRTGSANDKGVFWSLMIWEWLETLSVKAVETKKKYWWCP